MGVDYHALESRTLWRVCGFAELERRPAGARYWLENRGRPAGQVVLQLTVAGSMRLRAHGRDHLVPAGHAALFAFGEPTAYGLAANDRDAYDCAWVNLEGEGLRAHWDLLRARSGPVVAIDEATQRSFRRLLALAAPRAATDPLVVADAVHQLVHDLLRGLGRSVARALPPVERALDELLRRPTQPSALKEVAKRFGCSREHLTRVFAQRVGVSPAAWVNRRRVDQALRLLRDTDLPLASVAEQAGFSSTHTLARHVRQRTGRSPRAQRRAS